MAVRQAEDPPSALKSEPKAVGLLLKSSPEAQ